MFSNLVKVAGGVQPSPVAPSGYSAGEMHEIERWTMEQQKNGWKGFDTPGSNAPMPSTAPQIDPTTAGIPGQQPQYQQTQYQPSQPVQQQPQQPQQPVQQQPQQPAPPAPVAPAPQPVDFDQAQAERFVPPTDPASGAAPQQDPVVPEPAPLTDEQLAPMPQPQPTQPAQQPQAQPAQQPQQQSSVPVITLEELNKFNNRAGRQQMRQMMRKYKRHTAATDMNSEMDRWKTLMASKGYKNMSNADYWAWKRGLTKASSALTKEEVEDRKGRSTGKAEKALRAYTEAPTKANLMALAAAMEDADAMSPVHLQGGIYRNTKDTLSRAKEMWGRGNYLRGALGYMLGVPVDAVADTLKAPWTWYSRTLAPNVNTKFNDPEELRDMDLSDRAGIKLSARELLDLIGEDRADPTSYFENVNNLKKRLRTSTAQTVGDMVHDKKLSDEEGEEYSLISPYTTALTEDIVSMPHTAVLNLIGLNGARRYKYEGKKQDEYMNKKSSASSCVDFLGRATETVVLKDKLM